MDKKIIIIGGSVIIMIAVLLVVFWPQQEVEEYFTPEPEIWIQENDNTADNDDLEINIFKATKMQGQYEQGQLDLKNEGNLYSYFYHIIYEGEFFGSVALDDLFYNLSSAEKKEMTDEYTYMAITNNIVPENSIPEGFVVVKFEDNNLAAYAYLDEDWKRKYPDTKLIVGEDFSDEATLTEQRFDFSGSNDGIYVNKILRDISFMESTISRGGIAIGPIDKGELARFANQEDLNLTFIYMR